MGSLRPASSQHPEQLREAEGIPMRGTRTGSPACPFDCLHVAGQDSSRGLLLPAKEHCCVLPFCTVSFPAHSSLRSCPLSEELLGLFICEHCLSGLAGIQVLKFWEKVQKAFSFGRCTIVAFYNVSNEIKQYKFLS